MRKLLAIVAAALLAVSCGTSPPTAPSRASVETLGSFGELQPMVAASAPASRSGCWGGPGDASCLAQGWPRRARASADAASVSAPLNLAATATGGNVTLTWVAASSAAAYIIEAGSAPGLANLANFSTGNAQTLLFASGV